MLATCTLRFVGRAGPRPPRSVSLTASRPGSAHGLSASEEWPGNTCAVGVDRDRGVVDRGRGLAEADGDQPHLAGVLGDVAGGEDPRQVGPHRRSRPRCAASSTSMPHSCIGPRSAMKPSAATTACAGRVVVSSPTRDLDRLEQRRRRRSAVTSALVMISTEEARTCSTVRSWARNASRRCTSVTDSGDRLEVQRPVEGAVAAADDHDVLAGVRREAGHEELQAAAQPALAGRQRPRAELADAGGDQHRAGTHRRCRRRGRR